MTISYYCPKCRDFVDSGVRSTFENNKWINTVFCWKCKTSITKYIEIVEEGEV